MKSRDLRARLLLLAADGENGDTGCREDGRDGLTGRAKKKKKEESCLNSQSDRFLGLRHYGVVYDCIMVYV